MRRPWAAVGRFGSVLALVLSSLAVFSSQQRTPIGVVLEAVQAQVGSTLVSAGDTVFAGDLLNTGLNGRLRIQIGSVQFLLMGSSVASVFSRPGGVLAELERGALVFSGGTTGNTIEVMASDVRMTPRDSRPVLGEVALISPCELRITSRQNPLEVLVGKEKKVLGEAGVYRVTPVHAVDSRDPRRISPLDPAFHDRHFHRHCPFPVPPDEKLLASRVAFVGAATATILIPVLLDRSKDVSPSKMKQKKN